MGGFLALSSGSFVIPQLSYHSFHLYHSLLFSLPSAKPALWCWTTENGQTTRKFQRFFFLMYLSLTTTLAVFFVIMSNKEKAIFFPHNHSLLMSLQLAAGHAPFHSSWCFEPWVWAQSTGMIRAKNPYLMSVLIYSVIFFNPTSSTSFFFPFQMWGLLCDIFFFDHCIIEWEVSLFKMSIKASLAQKLVRPSSCTKWVIKKLWQIFLKTVWIFR